MCAKDLMQFLDESSDPVLLDIWRQTSFLSSAGSSPTPNTQPSLPTIPDHHPLMRSHLSKSEAPLNKPGFDGNVTSDSGKSSTQMQTSGSQTDSLDSPDPTPRHSKVGKDKRYHDGRNENEKSRHSMVDNMLEKIKNFRHPRQKGSDKEADNDGTLKADISPIYTCEPPSDLSADSVVKNDKDNTNKKHVNRPNDIVDENSLTWPKCARVVTTDAGGTVVYQSPQKRHERPKLDNVINPLDRFKVVPPTPPERTDSFYTAARHSPQSSDSTITSRHRHSPQNSDSTLKQFGAPSPVSSPKAKSKSGQYLSNNVSSGHFTAVDHSPQLETPPYQSRTTPSDLPAYTSRSRTNPRPSREAYKRNTVYTDYNVQLLQKDGYHPPVVSQKKHLEGSRRSRAHITNKQTSHPHRSQDYIRGPPPQFDFNTGPNTGSMRWSHHFSPQDSVGSPPGSIGQDIMSKSLNSAQAQRSHSNRYKLNTCTIVEPILP